MDISQNANDVTPKPSPYKRRQKNLSTLTAISFLEDVAVDLPDWRTVSRRSLQQRKVLPKRLKWPHRDFLTQHMQNKVSLRTFYRNLSQHIKTVSYQTYRQCPCALCVNVDLLLDGLKPFLEVEIEGRDIASEMSLCTVPTLACYNRECSKCAVTLVEHHIRNNLKVDPGQQVAKWHAWMLVKKEKGQRRERVEVKGTLLDLLLKLQEELAPCSKHVFVYRFQYMQYKLLLSSLTLLPDKRAVVVCDFSENCLCKYQDEVQSTHWGYNQVTVHPTVLSARPLSLTTLSSWATTFSMTCTSTITSWTESSTFCEKRESPSLSYGATDVHCSTNWSCLSSTLPSQEKWSVPTSDHDIMWCMWRCDQNCCWSRCAGRRGDCAKCTANVWPPITELCPSWVNCPSCYMLPREEVFWWREDRADRPHFAIFSTAYSTRYRSTMFKAGVMELLPPES